MAVATRSRRGVIKRLDAPVPGVQVRLYDANNRKIRSTTTDEFGRYLLTNLHPGTYEIRFFGEGFRPKDKIVFSISSSTGSNYLDGFLIFSSDEHRELHDADEPPIELPDDAHPEDDEINHLDDDTVQTGGSAAGTLEGVEILE